ncbi:YjbH domain-containing protein [Gammaproteobacteria bacterium]|nr:YjbH domain-containing protein [Gammaproteobacteria bacterium]
MRFSRRSCMVMGAILFSISLKSANIDYIYPKKNTPSYSNYGTVGLIQMPNARFQEAGSLAFTWSDIDPVLRGSIVAYPFSWFEAAYQYADINNALYSDVKQFSGLQTYKDKSFDLKFRLLKESNNLPSLAIGARDLAGTAVFASEYVVASKKIHNVDFTLGMGWGVFTNNSFRNPLIDISERFRFRSNGNNDSRGGEISADTLFSGDAALFGGAEIYLPNLKGLRIKLEYDAIDYKKEGFPFGSKSFNLAFNGVKQPRSNINIGLVYPISEKFHLKVSYVKGNTISFGFSMQAGLGRKDPFIKKNDPPKIIPNAQVIKKVNSKDTGYVFKTALKYLGEEKIYLQNANIHEKTLEVVYAQSKHASWARASGRTLRVLDQIAPDYIDTFKISNINGYLGMHSLEIPRDDFSGNLENKYYKLAARNIKISPYEYDVNNYEFQPKAEIPAFFWKIAPSLRSQIGGPDGFYFGDLRLAFHSEAILSKGLTFVSSATIGIYNNFDKLKLKSDSIIPHVRTDIVDYLQSTRKFALQRAQFNYFIKPTSNIYIKFSAGIFEEMFGGYGGEILFRPFKSNFGIGMESWKVKQREYDMKLSFRGYETFTGHINLYYKEPRSQIILAIKKGTFLAGDEGTNYDFSRRFKSGLRIGAFFSNTNLTKAEFGEGSFDKGFYFHVPIEMFFSKHSKGLSGFGLRPITRDGAAILIHAQHLWGITEQAQSINITRDLDDLYD